uniref:Uncharacterized protein n=1 Tax=Peronospora matthiolae TaxID=2874970 RepID=A0AAV1T0Z1_9STRA
MVTVTDEMGSTKLLVDAAKVDNELTVVAVDCGEVTGSPSDADNVADALTVVAVDGVIAIVLPTDEANVADETTVK